MRFENVLEERMRNRLTSNHTLKALIYFSCQTNIQQKKCVNNVSSTGLQWLIFFGAGQSVKKCKSAESTVAHT